MVKLKFIVLDGVLALRISENKARYYKRVTHLLKGKPNLEKHWVKEKECFSAYAISYAENNQILEDFKAVYWELITEHPELTTKQVANYYKSHFTTPETKPQEKVSEWPVEEYRNSVEKYLETVILREKAKQGCNHESYYKLLTRCRADIPGFDTMAFSTIDYNKMVGIAYIFARKRAYRNTAKSFRALLGRAHKDKDVMFYFGQIGTFCFSDYNPGRYDVAERLKEAGKELGIDFNLYAYVLRHTAITVAINNGVPISYIANAAGTSVEMLQQHYYKGECAKKREMLASVFMRAGV